MNIGNNLIIHDMKRYMLISPVLLLILFTIKISGQKINMKQSSYFHNALIEGLENYIKNKDNQLLKYSVIIVKVIRIDKKIGELSISNIDNDGEYYTTNPSHYMNYNNMLILIRTDSLFNGMMSKLNINEITEKIRSEAFNTLAGPNNTITGQPPPIGVVKYKRDKTDYKLYCGICRCEEKYWYFNDKR